MMITIVSIDSPARAPAAGGPTRARQHGAERAPTRARRSGGPGRGGAPRRTFRGRRDF